MTYKEKLTNLLCEVDEVKKDIIELITSKKFIECIAKEIEKWVKADYVTIWNKQIFYDSTDTKNWFNNIVEELTIQQAIAIRDNKLEEFIKYLIK